MVAIAWPRSRSQYKFSRISQTGTGFPQVDGLQGKHMTSQLLVVLGETTRRNEFLDHLHARLNVAIVRQVKMEGKWAGRR